ncbi:MAG: cob(I)yrinic acid a,c-diamide adenosyltransferase [Deltaproteobacteria bacterium]|nr:cob(I)yrinic acid a,c-diamide adenosyltransferase [Deltaproteobacteria bacterium]
MAQHEKTRGLIIVNTGTGKGKTTAALGAALRASGNGMRVMIIQFIKGAWKYGELEAIKHLPNAEIHPLGLGMTKRHESTERDAAKATEAWQRVRTEVFSDRYDLIVLDEINLALHFGFVPVQDVLELLRTKPERLHIILTGRYAPEEIMDIADTVTEMTEIKHHYKKGVAAQKGIEF